MAGLVQARKLLKRIFLNIYFITLVLSILIVLIFGYYVYQHEINYHFKPKLVGLARTTAAMNVDSFRLILTDEGSQTDLLLKIKNNFLKIKETNPDVKDICIYRKSLQNNLWECVVDSNLAALPGNRQLMNLSAIKAVVDSNDMTSFFNPNKLGGNRNYGVISGVAPIRNGSAQLIGLLVISMETQRVVEHLEGILVVAVGLLFLFMALTASITLKRINSQKPISHVIKQVEENLSTTKVLLNPFEADLQSGENQDEKIFKVYRDVLFSVSQGKFNLIGSEACTLVNEEGELLHECELQKAEDIYDCRELVRKLLEEKGFSHKMVMRVILCVSEAATNIIKHAVCGKIYIRAAGDTYRIIFIDKGPGMDYDILPNMIFLNGFSTKLSLGCGFTLMYRYASQIHLSTSKNGTFLALNFENI